MIGDIRRIGIRVALVLPGRGSAPYRYEGARPPEPAFSHAGRQGEPIKRIIREHAADVEAGGDAKAVVEYTARGKDGAFAHRLAILPRKGYARSDPVEAYVVFATNMDRGAVLGRIAMLFEEYRERWEIETGSRHQGGNEQDAQPVRPGAAHSGLLCHDAVQLLDHCKVHRVGRRGPRPLGPAHKGGIVPARAPCADPARPVPRHPKDSGRGTGQGRGIAARRARAAASLMPRQGRRRRAHYRNPATAPHFRGINGGARHFWANSAAARGRFCPNRRQSRAASARRLRRRYLTFSLTGH